MTDIYQVPEDHVQLVDVAEEQPQQPEYVPTFDNPDTFISDMLYTAARMPTSNGMALTAAALTLARAGMITTIVSNLKNDPETMALNLAPLAVDSSDELTGFWLAHGGIREKVWNHKREEEVAGSIVAIILEEAFELIEACVKPAHFEVIFKPLIEDLKFQIKTLKTGLNVEMNYTELRDALTDIRVTVGNMTAYYGDMPQGEDLCEIMASNMSKIVGDEGFQVNENLKIQKPESFFQPQLTYWVPAWKRTTTHNTEKLESSSEQS